MTPEERVARALGVLQFDPESDTHMDLKWAIEAAERAARIDECERALWEDAAFEKPRFFYLQDRIAELRNTKDKL